MPHITKIPQYADKILETLRRYCTNHTSHRMVERAKIILKSIERQSDASKAQELRDKAKYY
ncbi:MAG: hypothetical protein LBF22_04540 [Deltaproteobacteria bacterium]|jgi:hypothetical protein|nr:hypothetical protein [Deltaproteobacteria bacterium]